MCCFSQPAVVSSTQIFARRGSKDTQYLVYSMNVSAKQDLAMILPLPVPKQTAESAVKFIDLSKYSEFFTDLDRGFPDAQKSFEGAPGSKGLGAADRGKLAVVSVGSFEASFVPTIDDFDRLDKQFRLPKSVWRALPKYKSYGFAVFKLKSKDRVFHPMAFEFPTSLSSELFFPTVHIHDGKVRDTADFDHSLYCQIDKIHPKGPEHWVESAVPVGMIMDYTRGMPVIERYTHVFRAKIVGKHKNRDVLVS